jgi:hypothetical protein
LTSRWLSSPSRELFESSFVEELDFEVENYGVGEEVVSVDSVAGDSLVVELVVVSDEGVAVALASGVAVSVFFSQAASNPMVRKMQIYLVMARFVGGKYSRVNTNFVAGPVSVFPTACSHTKANQPRLP